MDEFRVKIIDAIETATYQRKLISKEDGKPYIGFFYKDIVKILEETESHDSKLKRKIKKELNLLIEKEELLFLHTGPLCFIIAKEDYAILDFDEVELKWGISLKP